jgi:hypothetical protein
MPPPGNLRHFESRSHAVAGAACQWPVLSFDFEITTAITSRVIMRGGLAYTSSDMSHRLLPRSAEATAAMALDAEVGY